ncbi:MAG: LamG domain-containing protein, partial [Kiritimatiellales bacterium]|nr:LamG domain-containing protein [Kiritimatiellales bacterium]
MQLKHLKPQLNRPTPSLFAVLVAAAVLVISGSAAFAEIATFGNSYDLTGNPLAIPANTAYGSWPLTVECRVKLDRQDKYNIIIANETKASPRHWEFYTTPKNGNFSAYLPGFKPALFDTGVSIADGKWHALAMIVEETNIRLFVDGELKINQSVTAPSAPALGQGLALGALVEGGMDCAGQIDEVRISKCVGPISGVATAPFIKNADTVGLWQFEEKTASVAKAALKPATTSLDMTPTGTSCDLTLGPATIPPNAAYSSWPLTVECRIKLMPKNTFSVIIANETKASPRHWELYATPGNGNLCAYLPGFTPSSFNTTVSVADGQWHALAMVVEETRVRLFMDGKLIQEQVVTAPSTPALGQPLRLGALVEGGFDCTGQIDEVRISKGARPVSGLSGAAITDDDSTVGLWQFEDNTPGVARDASKLKNDARLPPPDLGSLFKATLDFSKGMASIPVDAAFEQRPLTIDCWVKIPQTTSDPQAAFRSVLLSYGNLNDVADQGHWNLVTGPRPWFSMPGRCGIIAKTPIQDNKWHHLALVLESNQARIFVDGIEEAKG